MSGGAGGKEVGRISIRVVPNLDGFRKRVKAELEAIEQTLKGDVEINAHLDSAQARADFQRLLAQMKAQAAKGVHIKTEMSVDRDRTSQVLAAQTRAAGRLQGMLSKFNKMVSPGFGSGINPAGYALIALGVLATAAPLVGIITTSLMAIPGFVAAIGIPIAAVTLGLDGIKEAAKSLEAPFQKLKDTMNQANKDAFSPVFEKLTPLIEKVQAALPRVSQGLADMLDGAIAPLISEGGLGKIQGIITRIGEMLTQAAPGAGKFSNALLGLADQLSLKFPNIANWINQMGTRFDNWVTKISEDGSLSTAFDNLGGVIQTVIDLVADLGSKGIEFMSDTTKVDNFRSALEKVADVINKVMDASSKFFEVWDKLENSQLETFLEKNPDRAKSSWNIFAEQLNGLWNNLKPDKVPEMDIPIFGEDMSHLDGDKEKLKGWFAEAAKEASSEFQNNVEFMGGGGSFDTAEGILGGLATQFEGAFRGVLTTVQGQIAAIGPTIQAAVQQATAPLQQIPAQIVATFSQIAPMINGAMAPVVVSATNAASQVVTGMTSHFAQIPQIATAHFSQIATIAQTQMAAVVAAIQTGAAQSVAAVQNMGQQIVAALQTASAGAEAAGREVGAGMARGIRASIPDAVAAARDLAGQVNAAARTELAIKSPSRKFHEIGVFTSQGLANGINAGAPAAIEQAKSLSQQITDAMNSGLENVDTKSLSEQLKKVMDELDLVSKQWKVDYNRIPKEDKDGREAFRAQRDELQALRDQLSLQKEQLGYSTAYGEQEAENTNKVGEHLSKVMEMGNSFAEANANQLQQDLGMGGGAITGGISEGVGYLTGMLSNLMTGAMGGGTTINVGSVDEAVDYKSRTAAKQALQYYRR